MRTHEFFFFARERYLIKLRRDEGQPKPWTMDPVLQSYRFCNVFREDDAVTKWFRQAVRDPLRNDHKVVFATVAFRFFNTVRTGEVMLEHDLFESWDPEVAREVLSPLKPLITGAYMVKTPVGVFPKLEGLIQILDPIWADQSLYRDINGGTLRQAWERLQKYPWVGGFMAYEFVTDLRHTRTLEEAPDVNSWGNPGPGATRGLERVLERASLSEQEKLETMRALWLSAQKGEYWPSEWPRWEMREVEHLLCEFDKYERARLGEGRPKQLYDGK